MSSAGSAAGSPTQLGRRVVAEWEAEQGAFTPEELAAARAELAAADNEYFHGDASVA